MARKHPPKRRSHAKPKPPPPRGTTDRDKRDRRASWRCSPSSRSSRSAWPKSPAAPASRSPQLRAEFGSTLAILAAHIKEIDREVLAGVDADMAEESPRERLFDVLMRRLEALAPHKEAVRSLLRSARRDPPLALALNAMAVRSQQWMLTAAGIGASGPKGMVRAQGAGAAVRQRAATWVDDDDDGLARTWRRSTASWRAASAGPACSTICAAFPKRVLRGPRRAPRARRERAGDARRSRVHCEPDLDRHAHRRAQAAERAVAERDVAAVRARDVARDGEAEAGAALVLIARIVEPQERLEHFLAHAPPECPARRRRP